MTISAVIVFLFANASSLDPSVEEAQAMQAEAAEAARVDARPVSWNLVAEVGTHLPDPMPAWRLELGASMPWPGVVRPRAEAARLRAQALDAMTEDVRAMRTLVAREAALDLQRSADLLALGDSMVRNLENTRELILIQATSGMSMGGSPAAQTNRLSARLKTVQAMRRADSVLHEGARNVVARLVKEGADTSRPWSFLEETPVSLPDGPARRSAQLLAGSDSLTAQAMSSMAWPMPMAKIRWESGRPAMAMVGFRIDLDPRAIGSARRRSAQMARASDARARASIRELELSWIRARSMREAALAESEGLVEALSRQDAAMEFLLDALASGKVLPADLTMASMERLELARSLVDARTEARRADLMMRALRGEIP